MLRGLVDENHPILLLIYRANKMVVRVGLAPTVFLMWRVYSPLRSLLSHLTKNVLCSARRTGLEPAGRIPPHGLTARCNTILLTSEQSTERSPNQFAAVSSATH